MLIFLTLGDATPSRPNGTLRGPLVVFMDSFSDDDLDNLDDDALQQLENTAIQLTQAAHKTAPTQDPAVADQQGQLSIDCDFDDDDLDDADVFDEQAQQRAAVPTNESHAPTQHQPPPFSVRPQYPIPGARQYHVPAPSSQFSQAAVPPRPLPSRPVPSQFVRPALPVPRPVVPQPSQQPARPAGTQHEFNALQARLSELQRELHSAKGEAAMLRSKFNKVLADHNAEIAQLKKSNAEHVAKQERTVEAALAAQHTAATELEFTRQDLRLELDNRARGKKKDAGGGATTPQKNRSFRVDGFDEVEVLPDTGAGRTVAVPVHERTPTKAKRKRPVVDSPVNALETHSEDVVMRDGPRRASDPVTRSPAATRELVTRAQHGELPFDFLKLALDHSASHGRPLTFELFSRYAFPTQPGDSFAAMFFGQIPRMSTEPRRLLVEFAQLVLEMWTRCLTEKYHCAIYDLAALLALIFQLNAVDVAPLVITDVVHVAQLTCYLLAIPRFNTPDDDLANHPDQTVRQLLSEIDVTQSLSILYMTAVSTLQPPGDSVQNTPFAEFWKGIELEFVLYLLSPSQPEADFLGMLSLLCASVSPTSIGPIPNPVSLTTSGASFGDSKADEKTPELIAKAIINRMSAHLVDPPRWTLPMGSMRHCRICLALLSTLLCFATSPFGALQLAGSEAAIPNIVITLSWAVDQLYNMEMPPMEWPSEGGSPSGLAAEQDAHETQAMYLGASPHQGQTRAASPPSCEIVHPTPLLLRIIALTTQLLHTLATGAAAANVPARLAAHGHGTAQRYQLALARLNYADDDLVLEAGVDAATVDRANELIEGAVGPDEAESLRECFGG